MAQNAPKSIEIEQIQFKLHAKGDIFQSNGQLKSNINLLATSSNCGLIIVGDPNKPQFKVVPIQGVVNAKNLSGKLLCREVPLPSIADNIAISCDGSLLAVNYTIQNTCFLSIYFVPSFLSPNIVTKFANIPLVSESNVTVTQILWNPVISNTLAIILNNGALLMYNLKETNYEFFSLDKSEQAKCACWSPKGKQIVVGFPSGKLMQFKPDLKPARTILCPNNIHDAPFDTIAVQWLSTYQFAAAFLQHGEDLTPCLYIINAPKTGNPIYINYYDICFSASGPRIGQIFLIHVHSWNLLLVASANSMEMGILGTTESNETPTWFEYTMSDDSVRLALPMTVDKEETYPIGISFDTGITHQLTMNEHQLPVMPMVHLLSTHGQLVSFDFLNLNPNTPGICSPPQLLIGQSELNFFKPFETIVQKRHEPAKQQQIQPDSSFMANFGAATSTPAAKTKPKPLFGETPVTSSASPNILSFGTLNKPAATGTLGATQQIIPPSSSQFPGSEQQTFNFFSGSSQQQQSIPTKPGVQLAFTGQNSTNTTKANLFTLPSSTTVQLIPTTTKIPEVTTKTDNSEKNKPLYTIPPTFKPTTENKSSPTIQKHREETEKNINFSDINTINVINEMIAVEINSFQLEFDEVSKKSKSVDISIGNIQESKNCTKRLDDLKVLSDQAQETIFETDVQILRHSVNECFSMIAEAKSKLEIVENSDIFKLTKISGCDQSNRRKLAKLNSYVATNQVQLKMIQQQIDSNWSAYQDLVHQNSKVRMQIPSLEGIYQTLTKQKDILATQRKKLTFIKRKLNIRDLINNKNLSSRNSNITVDSLADSILSMSLSEHVKKENSRLSEEKLQAIRDALKGRKIIFIKPNRPERMKSEVILECKLKAERKRDGAVTKAEKMMLQSRIENQTQQEPIIISKPAATKPIATKPVYNEQVKVDTLNQQQQKSSLNFTGQLGIEGKSTTDKIKSQSNISFSNSESTNIFGSGSIPNVSAGTNLFGGNMFGTSKPNPGSLFSGNQFSNNSTEKSAFAIPTSFSGFSGADSKNDNTKTSIPTSFSGFSGADSKNDNTKTSIPTSFSGFSGADSKNDNTKTSIPTFNFSNVKTTTTEKQQQKEPNKSDNHVFTPLTGSNAIPTFTGFNLGSNTATAKDSKPFIPGPNTPLTTLSTSKTTTTSSTTSATKDKTDELLANLNICKPTATSAKAPENLKPENLFGPAPTPAAKPSFADLNPTPSSNTENMKPNFTGIGATTEGSVTPAVTSSEVKSTTTSSTQQTNKISFSGFATNIKTTEPSKTPFFGFAQAANDTMKSTGFSGFGTTNPESSKSVFGGFGSSVITTSTETTKTPFSGFGVSTEATKTPFSGFGTTVTTSSADRTKSIFGSLSTTTTTTSSNTTEPSKISFSGLGIPVTSADTTQTFGVQLNASEATALTTTTPATTTATITSTISSSEQPTFGALNLTLSAAPAFGTSALASDTTASIASSTIPDPTTTPASKPESQPSIFSGTTTATTTTGFGVFPPGGTPSIFGGATMGQDSTSSPLGFGSLTGTTTTAPSIFAAAAATTLPFASSPVSSTTSIFDSSPSSTPRNIFGGAAGDTNTGSIFGGIPKPDQSVFANATTAFANQSNTSGSIFGGSNAPNQPASPFAQQASPFQSAGTSIFGGQKGATTNIFGTSNQPNQQSSGSIFSQQSSSSFGVSQDAPQTSIFGAAAAESSGFAGGSIFGGSNQTMTSPFGGAPQSSGFGTGPFSSGSTAGAFIGFGTSQPSGGAFAQGGPSIAQTGFGSPNSSFSKPSGVFGGSPAFGSPPTFGGSPSFGGPPTFGGFGNTQTTGGTSPTAFSPSTQKNNLFEALGSSGDNVSSFGNLAQNANQNTTKPAFSGGSSFSSWR